MSIELEREQIISLQSFHNYLVIQNKTKQNKRLSPCGQVRSFKNQNKKTSHATTKPYLEVIIHEEHYKVHKLQRRKKKDLSEKENTLKRLVLASSRRITGPQHHDEVRANAGEMAYRWRDKWQKTLQKINEEQNEEQTW